MAAPDSLADALSKAPISARPDQAISGASVRLRALAALSGSLTDALDPGAAAHLVEQQALTALGATGAVVMTLGEFPPRLDAGDAPHSSRLTAVHSIGLPHEATSALAHLPLDAAVPMAEVARTGTPLFFAIERELPRFPEWGQTMLRAGARAAAIVPVWANGELRGVLGLSWSEPRVFDEDERAFVLTLGVMCAQAIMRAYLREAERKARELAEDANHSKTQFLTMISHELRTPMNAVLGYTQLIAEEVDGPVSPLQKEHLGRVRASGKHLLSLIEELLEFARVESGGDIARLEPVSLADVVKESVVLVGPVAEARGLKVRVDCPETPVELYTDPGKLRQILVNLLANAVKFTDAGDVALIVRVEGVDAAVMVHFEVTDTGRGIEESDQPHVFDAYWRKESSAGSGSSGTGLGLPVARQLARLLGGDVVLSRSAPGEGSTFILSLPARYAAAAAGAAAAPAA